MELQEVIKSLQENSSSHLVQLREFMPTVVIGRLVDDIHRIARADVMERIHGEGRSAKQAEECMLDFFSLQLGIIYESCLQLARDMSEREAREGRIIQGMLKYERPSYKSIRRYVNGKTTAHPIRFFWKEDDPAPSWKEETDTW